MAPLAERDRPRPADDADLAAVDWNTEITRDGRPARVARLLVDVLQESAAPRAPGRAARAAGRHHRRVTGPGSQVTEIAARELIHRVRK